MRIWIDITAPAHVLVFRPLIALLRERGDEVEVTAREYAQTVQLLHLHGIEAELIGRHGGRSRVGKLAVMAERLPKLRHWARAQQIAERWRQDLHHLVDQLQDTETSTHPTMEYKVLDQLGRSSAPLTAREVAQKIRGLTSEAAAYLLGRLVMAGQVNEIASEKTMRYRLVEAADDA